jgi:hypothetical protein
VGAPSRGLEGSRFVDKDIIDWELLPRLIHDRNAGNRRFVRNDGMKTEVGITSVRFLLCWANGIPQPNRVAINRFLLFWNMANCRCRRGKRSADGGTGDLECRLIQPEACGWVRTMSGSSSGE